MKITVVLHNIRSTYNVGAILRTCEGLGVEKVVYSGYTPRYNDADLLPHLRTKLNHQIAKSALGAEMLVPQEYLAKESDDLRQESVQEFSTGSTEVNLADAVKNTQQNHASLLTKWLKCATMEGYSVVGLENNLSPAEIPRQLILGQPTLANGEDLELQDQVILILGEEVHGIPAPIRPLIDYFLEIPMQGQKESFNVSVATGIALWGLQNCY